MADKPYARPTQRRLTIELTVPAAQQLSTEVAFAIMAATCRRAYADRDHLMSIAEQLDAALIEATRDTLTNTTTHDVAQETLRPRRAARQPAA